MWTKILDSSYYFPKNEIFSSDVEEKINFTFPKWLIQRLSWIETRRYSSKEEHPSVLASNAVKILLDRTPTEVDCIIFAAASSDLLEPATANLVWETLRNDWYLTSQVPVFDIKNACNSVLSALDVSDSLIQAWKYSSVLICSWEEWSKAINWNPKDSEEFMKSFSGYTLWDAGSALLLWSSSESRVNYSKFLSQWDLWNASTILWWWNRFRWHEHEEYFMWDSAKLKDFFKTLWDTPLQDWLNKVWWSLEEVQKVFVHQISLPMVKDFIAVSWIPEEKIKITIPELWNIASSSIPTALTMALENGEVQRGDKLIFIWFGAGASFGIMFLEY